MVFVKGKDPNRNLDGRPKGSFKEKSFIEYYDEISEDIAKENGMSVEDVKKIIYKVGYKKAKEGDYRFYKDVLDRVHGTATIKTDVTSGGLPIQISEVIAKKNDIRSESE